MVMGAGSIGSVAGGLLHLDGHDVTLVGKGPHIEAVMDAGLEITGIWGERRAERIPAFTSVEDAAARGTRPWWVLLCVKSYDTVSALEDLRPVLPAAAGVISMQNGLGNYEAIAEAAPGKAVGGRVIFGASTLSPGRVSVTVCADDVLLGAPDGPPGVGDVCDAFKGAGIPCRMEDRILSFIWDKVLYNVSLNALATLLKTDYGTLGDDPETRAVMAAAVRESYEVAGAEGVELVSPDADSYTDRFYADLLPPTREHRSSMQEDIAEGRRTEIEALNGAVWRLGEKHGIATPVNEMLTRLIRFTEEENPAEKG